MEEEKKKTIHEFKNVRRVLGILKILMNETDEKTTLSQTDIVKLLKKNEYACSERTLTDYLKVLMRELNPEDADGNVDDDTTIEDYKILVKGLEQNLNPSGTEEKKVGVNGLSLRDISYNHLFSFEELNQLVKAVLFLKSLDDHTKEKLIKKIQALSSKNYPEYCPYISQTTGKISTTISSVYEDSRVDELVVRDNLEKLSKAMNGQGIKIKFHFQGYDENKELIPRRNADGTLMEYIVNPYYVILYNSKHYLICSMDPYKSVSIYRIDLMFDITERVKESLVKPGKMIGEMRRPKRDINGLPLGWSSKDASEFQAEHLYMFYGEAENITLKLDHERYTLLHDYFGEHYSFNKHLDEKWDEVEVKCVPAAVARWAMQCSDYVEVLKPEKVRTDIKEKCTELARRYAE